MPEPRPTDEQRARWQDAIATDLNRLDWYERRDDLIDAIFAAGVEAALDGMTVEWRVRRVDGYKDRGRTFKDEARARAALREANRYHREAPDFYVASDLSSRRVTDWQAADDA